MGRTGTGTGPAGAVLADLRDEGDALDALVAGIGPADWSLPTPAPGWSVAHQIAHLMWTDDRALLAAEDEAAFARARETAAASLATFVDDGAAEGVTLAPPELLARWRAGRHRLAGVLTGLAARPEKPRLPWFGPPMSPVSMATARLMETWAHGEDVAAALGVRRAPTARLRHVVHLGVRTRDFAYRARGMEPPAEPFRFELSPPGGGEPWTHGPAGAGERISGEALDFCLLVTQRLHRDDARLRAEGARAEEWLGIAQAFAGPPGAGRAPAGAARPGPAAGGSDGPGRGAPDGKDRS